MEKRISKYLEGASSHSNYKRKLEAKLVEYTEALEAHREAFELARTVSLGMQAQAQAAIADVVTRCLQAIFGERYTFEIEFKEQRNRTSCAFILKREGVSLDPLTETGGGVVDIIAFALRVAVLVASKPPRRRLLLLDEPAKFLSDSYKPSFATLISKLAEELHIQFVIITHVAEFQLGTVVHV